MSPSDNQPESAPITHLFELAVREATSGVVDDEAYRTPIRALQKCAPTEVWALIAPLAHAPDERVRALVPDVLRFLGGDARPLAAEAVELLGKMLETERATKVLESIAMALGEIGEQSAVELLRPFVNHPSELVRLAVVCGLIGVPEKPIALLIGLSRDADDEVRNWATFGLGDLLGERGEPDFINTPEVRDALAARLDDPHDETRAEAALGLAIRGDQRAVPRVIHELELGTCWNHYVDAAEALADERLIPALERYAVTHPTERGLAPAFQACRSRR